MSEYFEKPESLGGNVKVDLDLSNYVTKVDSKSATVVDISYFSKTTDLASLKSDVNKLNIDKLKKLPSNLSNLKGKVDQLDIGKLETTPGDLSKLSNVAKNNVVEKTDYDELVKKVIKIDTTDTSDSVKIRAQKLMKLKRKLLIIIMVNILLLQNLIS